jgi:hypothetical protein
LFLGFALLGYMGLLLVGLQFMSVGLPLGFVILYLVDWVEFCVPRNFDLFVDMMNRIATDMTRALILLVYLGLIVELRMQIGNTTLVRYVLVLLGDVLG